MGVLIKNINERNLTDLEVYFKNILEGFNWILEVAVITSDIHKEEVEVKAAEQKVNLYIEGYNNLDLLFVSDVVEYELMPKVEKLYNLFYNSLAILQNSL
jgi:hypothetical protein